MARIVARQLRPSGPRDSVEVMRRALVLAALVLLAGCASAPFPEAVMQTVNRAITVSELRANPGAYLGQRVIVGGEIISTEPKAGETEVELLTHPLGSGDRPRHTDRSDGRVIVRSKQFLDPALYAKDRRLTAVGTVAGGDERRIGDQPYLYPVIEAEDVKLWPRDPPPDLYPYPGYPWGWPYYYPGYNRYGPWGPGQFWW